MRLLIVRHGVPDYQKDTITEQGWKEAELLAPYILRKNPDLICLSPYGRAQDTAKKTLELTGLTPVVYPWLCEVDFRFPKEHPFGRMWHTDPKIWLSDPLLRTPDWQKSHFFKDSDFVAGYNRDRESLDSFLAEHGYVRDGALYRVTEEFYGVNETVVFFCHLGRGVTLLSQLLDLPWVVAAHQFWLPTSSITEITFERSHFDRSVALARCTACGSVPHLDAADVPRCNSGFLMPIDGYVPEEDPVLTLSQ